MEEMSTGLEQSDVVSHAVFFKTNGTRSLVNRDHVQLLKRQTLNLVCKESKTERKKEIEKEMEKDGTKRTQKTTRRADEGEEFGVKPQKAQGLAKEEEEEEEPCARRSTEGQSQGGIILSTPSRSAWCFEIRIQTYS